MRLHAKHDSIPSSEEVRQQLKRILEDPEFQATGRQREFLQFVVTETIAGRVEEIKGYTVATEVFGRKEDFDQSIDPVVSIQASKLRRALERYYLVAGKNDPVRIDIPKGTYVPTFHERAEAENHRPSGESKDLRGRFEGSWPSVVVRPFQNLTGDLELNYLAVGLATELAMEITRYQDIRVLMHRSDGSEEIASTGPVRFAIDGSIRKDRDGIKVAVQMMDASTGMQIWGDTHRSDFEAAQLIAFQEEVAGVIAAKVASEQGIIAKTFSLESKTMPPSALKTYEAILRYYEFNLIFSKETFLRAFEGLKHAAGIEPECAQVWAMLGRLYGVNYSLELFNLETPLEEAVAFAEKGVHLNPANQRARAVLGFVRMLCNEIPAARAELEQALTLNSSSLIFLDMIGYLLILLGEWEQGSALTRKAIKLNPYYDPTVHYALWVDWIRQGKDEEAYLETLNFRRSAVFWEPLMRAASLGRLKRIEEGKRAAQDLLKLKPDFPSRGRILIGHYIKFDEIVERTIDGLSKVGLIIE